MISVVLRLCEIKDLEQGRQGSRETDELAIGDRRLGVFLTALGWQIEGYIKDGSGE